jgi:nicotinate-nucleotide adenylyltransferase
VGSAVCGAERYALYDEAMNQVDPGRQPMQSRPDALRGSFFGGSRVAFFGGSFDPPHLGHLAVARAALTGLRLDRVLFAPVGAQPLKPGGATASFEDRVEMTKLAIAGDDAFEVSLADAPKPDGSPNFTLETLLGLRAELGVASSLFCLMGADSFFGLRNWHRAADIPFAAALAVASRPEEPLDELQAALPQGLLLVDPKGTARIAAGVEIREFELVNRAGERAPFYVLPDLHVEISASEIRREMKLGENGPESCPVESRLLPAEVAKYIRAHGLYR